MATRTRQRSALAATLGLWICAAVIHAASPPENTATARSQGSGKMQLPNLGKGFQPGEVDQTTSSGRTLVRYQHSRDPGWGYEADGTDQFLVALPRKRGYSLTFAWEPFAHAATRIGEINPAVYDFPWLTIRKNEAYPVFARATTDQHYPGLNNSREPDQRGQINGYFRWKNLQEVDDRLEMELRLVRKEELPHPFDPPAAAEADLTLRRIQRFVVKAGRSYEWRMMAGSKALQSGKIVVGADGLLSVPKIRIAKEPTVFSLTPAQ